MTWLVMVVVDMATMQKSSSSLFAMGIVVVTRRAVFIASAWQHNGTSRGDEDLTPSTVLYCLL